VKFLKHLIALPSWTDRLHAEFDQLVLDIQR
jgi:hypothetical protein